MSAILPQPVPQLSNRMSNAAVTTASGLPASDEIIPLGASHQKIDEVAGTLAKTWGYEPGSDISEWVRSRLGGRVFPETSVTNLEYGYLRVPGHPAEDGRRPNLDIVLSPFTGEFQERFTIAHELGHYFLHSLAQDRKKLTVRREGRTRAETEANWFAEGFLMPREIFVQAWNDAKGSVPALIHRFKVAADVITMRHETLRKLGEDGFCYEGNWS
jgi:predicted transcriptional regulator